jgi:hypothetical protein
MDISESRESVKIISLLTGQFPLLVEYVSKKSTVNSALICSCDSNDDFVVTTISYQI